MIWSGWSVDSFLQRSLTPVPRSILDAVRDGQWDFEPTPCAGNRFKATEALPGSDEKLKILCDRVRKGLPLWHPDDRRFYVASLQTLS